MKYLYFILGLLFVGLLFAIFMLSRVSAGIVSPIEVLGAEQFIKYSSDEFDHVDYSTGVLSVYYAFIGNPIKGTEVVSPSVLHLPDGTYRIFSGVPQFYNKGGEWYEIEYDVKSVDDYQALPKEESFSFFVQSALADTLYPSMDGRVTNSDTLWSTTRGAVSGNDFGNTDTVQSAHTEYYTGDPGFYITRAWFYFDASALSGSATAGTFNVTPNTKLDGDNDGQDVLHLIRCDSASDSAVALGDYDNVVFENQSDTIPDITSITTGSNLSFTFNATGLSNLNVGGIIKLCVVEGHDYDNVSITTGSGDVQNRVSMRTSEYTGTASDPYIDITVVAGGGGAVSVSFDFYDVDLADKFLFNVSVLMFLGFMFPVWYFNKKRNETILK